MTRVEKWSIAGYTTLAAMCVIWIVYGWHIIRQGGFYSKPRHSHVTTYVDGIGATFMAFVMFSLAGICTAIILKRFNAPHIVSAVMTAAIVGSPLVYLLVR